MIDKLRNNNKNLHLLWILLTNPRRFFKITRKNLMKNSIQNKSNFYFLKYFNALKADK